MWRLKHKYSIPYYQQSESTECGLCSIAMIMSYYYCEYTINELREEYAVGRDGLNLLIIKGIFENKGFETNAYRIININDLVYPSIISINKTHFVVAEKATSNGVLIVDPLRGKYELDEKDFYEKNIKIGLCVKKTNCVQERKIKKANNIKRLLKGNMKVLLAGIFLTLLVQLMTLAFPLAIRYLADNIAHLTPYYNMKSWCVIIVILASVYYLLNYIKGITTIKLQININESISTSFVDKILNLPIKFFKNRSTGEIVHRYSGAVIVREIVSNKAVTLCLNLGIVIFYAIYLTIVSPKYMVMTGIFACISIIISIKGMQSVNKLINREVVEEANTTSYFNEIVRAISIIKMNANEANIYKKWKELFSNQLSITKEKNKQAVIIASLNNLLQFTTPLFVICIAYGEVIKNEMTIGTALSIFVVTQSFFSPINSFISVLSDIIFANSYLERISEVCDMESEAQLTDGIRDITLGGKLNLKDVSYKYSFSEKRVLNGISFDVRCGEFVGIVGETAAGKSTLAMLLMGLERPTEGNILFDDIDIKKYNIKTLRRQIGVVSQSTYFFRETIRENLTFGDKTISDKQIVVACKKAAIWDDINKMPMRLETILNEDATNISGGQRQRLALARAILLNPKILIIDEGTSALDNITEKIVQKSLEELRCTRIVIAHRLSTIEEADKIIVMKNGEIHSIGKHSELMITDNYYRKLYKRIMELNQCG